MRPANAPSPRMRRAKTPFAQCPCTQTAIRAGALNHPHHTNPMNHSSDKYQPALVHALTPVNPSIRRKKATSPTRTRPARPRARPSPSTRLPSCAQNFLPNLTQSLVNSRLTLLHLYVPFTFQRIGQRDNSYRLPAARIPLRFAQCPCTQTAIRAGAVNHPHHINHMNHSSNKCQPALVHALTPGNPSIRRKKATSPTRTRPPRPPARPSPSTRLPSCAQNFLPNLTQSLSTFSRNLTLSPSLRSLYISKNRTKRQLLPAACSKNPTAIRPVPMHADRDPRRRRQSSPSHKLRKSQFKQMPTSPRTCAPPVNPSIRRKKATSPTRTRPPRPPARPSPSTRLPSCAQNFLPNLTQSLVISRRTLVHLSCLSTLQPPQKCLQDESRLKPGLCRKIKQLNRGRLAFPSAIRNTKYAIQKSGFPI